MNFFDYNTAAKRYAKGRPYFHPLVIRKIAEYTRSSRFPNAIDVCCGTGQSTLALTEIADAVVGVDQSAEMLALASRHPALSYLCAPAEALPVAADAFYLMTVALGFHWLDREKFLDEAHRVLRAGAWLVIYQNHFCGVMPGNPEFARWNKRTYLTRYPTPPRNQAPFTRADADVFGFDFVQTENYANEVEFTPEGLACYLSTQSNMIAAIESGRESERAALTWLLNELNPLFTREEEPFSFGGYIWYLHKK